MGLYPPVTEGRSIKVTDWRNNFYPKLNGKALGLEEYETSRSLTILPDETGFLLGTDWTLRLYDSAGNIKWLVPAPSAVRAVNVSGDGKLAVAAFADGTIRWFRLSDGKELLIFFPHRDRKRWVL